MTLPLSNMRRAFMGGARQYATWSSTDKTADISLSGDLLTATGTGVGTKNARSDIGKSTGKWYFELNFNEQGSCYGISNLSHSISSIPGATTNSIALRPNNSGANQNRTYWNNTFSGASPNKSAGVYGFELDADTKTCAIRDAGGIFRTFNMTSGGGTAVSAPYYVTIGFVNPGTCVLNAGKSAFTYTPTSGFNLGLWV